VTEPSAAGPDGAVAVVGEALVDLVQVSPAAPFEALVGGSPANVAVGLARLGLPMRLAARIGEDVLGRRIRLHLERNGVDLRHAVAAAEPSTLAIAAIGEDGAAEYDFRVEGTADWQWRADEIAGAFDEVVAVHAGSLALTMEPGAEVLIGALARARATSTVSYDPNFRPLLMRSRETVRAQVARLVAIADVVKASADDLEWLLPGTSPEQVAQAWLADGPALVAVTLGPEGVVAAAREAGVVRLPGLVVDVADTIGAGDSFTSALLAGLHDRSLLGADGRDKLREIDVRTLGAVLELAVRASAITCTRRGAEPPTAAELAASVGAAPRTELVLE
jgi:fructokinase